MGKFLPLWIIGAPFVYIVFDWMRTPKSPRSDSRSSTALGQA